MITRTQPDRTGGQGFSGIACHNVWVGGRKEGLTTEFIFSGNSQSKVFSIKETLTAKTNLKLVILFTGYTIILHFCFFYYKKNSNRETGSFLLLIFSKDIAKGPRNMISKQNKVF